MSPKPGASQIVEFIVMAATFANVVTVLEDLEQRQFEAIEKRFKWTEALRPHLRGSIQSYAVNKQRDPVVNTYGEPELPVICAVGVNYTQDGPVTETLVRYGGQTGRNIGVKHSTNSTRHILSVIGAYRRNQDNWIELPAKDPRSPLGFYGSQEAMAKIPPSIKQNDFILIMTNFCPFITVNAWGRLPNTTAQYLLQQCKAHDPLGRLHDKLGESIDLWIGHSAIPGTRWVWPAFAEFVQNNSIQEWLLTPNINPMAHLYLEKTFRQKGHRLYPWYK